MNPAQAEMAAKTNPQQLHGSLPDALKGRDVFIGVSAPGIVTADMVATMARDAIVFAMANPTPEIMPEEAKKGGARIVAAGRSDFPNQINNVLVFPGIFRGALNAAVYAIADIIGDTELTADYIIPGAFDSRVAEHVAEAVAEAAVRCGVSKI